MHSVGSAQAVFIMFYLWHKHLEAPGLSESPLFFLRLVNWLHVFFISCFGRKVKQSDSLVYFVTVDPYVLSLKVLFVCYCDHAASVQERLPGRNPATVLKRRAETRSRIRADVESQTFRNETDFGHRCRLHCTCIDHAVRLSHGPAHRNRLSKRNAHRHCYSTVNSLNASLRAVCIVATDTWLWSKFW